MAVRHGRTERTMLFLHTCMVLQKITLSGHVNHFLSFAYIYIYICLSITATKTIKAIKIVDRITQDRSNRKSQAVQPTAEN